jgi:ribosomal protein S18 acetylase RimI-like enzyme
MAMSLVRDDWLSEQLGQAVYSVSPPLLEDIPPGLSFVRVDVTDISTVAELQSAGFELVATGVSFERALPIERRESGVGVRMARPGDEAQVCAIARESFVFDHFHVDKRLPKERCDALKEAWSRNYFRGGRGDWMLVAETPTGIGGFLLLLGRDDRLIIDLIAVGRDYRGSGIAQAMIAHAGHTLTGFNTMLVGTQLSNIPSVRLYESCGFRLAGAEHVLHSHR